MKVLFIALLTLFSVPACATIAASESAGAATQSATQSTSQLAPSATYEPMAPFAKFAGKTLRGEGAGPDGGAIVDIAKWEFILGGRALQTTHRVEGTSYGGRTIFFFDEAAQQYIFHYFTTAGFHTTGEVVPTERGFKSVEKVIGHAEISEVYSELIVEGNEIRVLSNQKDKNGNLSDVEERLVYRVIDHPGPTFNESN